MNPNTFLRYWLIFFSILTIVISARISQMYTLGEYYVLLACIDMFLYAWLLIEMLLKKGILYKTIILGKKIGDK